MANASGCRFWMQPLVHPDISLHGNEAKLYNDRNLMGIPRKNFSVQNMAQRYLNMMLPSKPTDAPPMGQLPQR